MTLRRLNIRIQGFPESYVTEPYMGDSNVAGEPHPIAVAAGPMQQDEMLVDHGMPPASLMPPAEAPPRPPPPASPAAAPSAEEDVKHSPPPPPPPDAGPAPTSHEIGVGDDPVMEQQAPVVSVHEEAQV